MDEPSGFFESPARAQSSSDGIFELISGNPESCCDIWRADRDGRFRVYKSLKAKYMGDPVYERLLRKEFEIGYSLKHQNICEYYAFVNLPQLGNCIEMEWVDGETLDSLLAREKMSKLLSLRVLSEICDALEYMHSKQVVHRDLKPSNIMLTHSGGYVKLIDFGLSDSPAHSVLKGSAGTQVYASPEQLSGGEVDLRSDIYSLGCVIGRLCPASSGLLLPSRASSLRRIARKCTRRDPSRRFQTASEVQRALVRKPSFAAASLLTVLLACLAALLVLRGWQSSDAERLASPSAMPSPTVSPASVSPSAVPTAGFSPSETISPSAAVPDSVQSVTSPSPSRSAGAASGAAGASKSAASRSAASRSASASASLSGASSQASASQSSATTSDQAAIDEIFRQATDLFGE